MASAEIALGCGLKVRVGCKDRLCENSGADETLAQWESRYVSKVLPHSCENLLFLTFKCWKRDCKLPNYLLVGCFICNPKSIAQY